MKRKTDNFDKFFKKKSNGAIKEKFKQEKKAAKKERKEAIEKHFEEKRALKAAAQEFPSSGGLRSKPGKADRKSTPLKGKNLPEERKPFRAPQQAADADRKAPSTDRGQRPPAFKKPGRDRPAEVPERKPFRSEHPPIDADRKTPSTERRPPSPDRAQRPSAFKKPGHDQAAGGAERKPFTKDRYSDTPEKKFVPADRKAVAPVQPAKASEKKSAADQKPGKSGKPAQAMQTQSQPAEAPTHEPGLIPLNKYIAHSGVCSRRDAADLIKQGKVSVNGKEVTDPGTRVAMTDIVKFDGKKLTVSKNFVYILLNKPKDYITTTEDPQGRKTVLALVRTATNERIYPVGRLDRNTSGVLLLTNDGDLAQKLAHPKHEVRKVYHVVLDKPLTKTDYEKIVAGVQLEDGLASVDAIAYADSKDKTEVGLEIHSGRNRIVRRIFEHLGYDVRGLDRVVYAGLTKKNVPRGNWRLLTEKEIRILKYLNSSGRKH